MAEEADAAVFGGKKRGKGKAKKGRGKVDEVDDYDIPLDDVVAAPVVVDVVAEATKNGVKEDEEEVFAGKKKGKGKKEKGKKGSYAVLDDEYGGGVEVESVKEVVNGGDAEEEEQEEERVIAGKKKGKGKGMGKKGMYALLDDDFDADFAVEKSEVEVPAEVDDEDDVLKFTGKKKKKGGAKKGTGLQVDEEVPDNGEFHGATSIAPSVKEDEKEEVEDEENLTFAGKKKGKKGKNKKAVKDEDEIDALTTELESASIFSYTEGIVVLC